MTTYFKTIVRRILALVSPTVSDLLTGLAKYEAKIEKALNKTQTELAGVAAASQTLADLSKQLNDEIDAGFKLLHKVSGLTK